MVSFLMGAKFKLGQLIMTGQVNDKVDNDETFAKFVFDSLKRYGKADWGKTCEEDRQMNDEALEKGYRILASYKKRGQPTIWIVTEYDRSATTVLMPDDYS